MGQERIAQIMKLSRPYVSKLLNAAREEGIVRIYVIDPLNIESSLEAEFRERFHLRKAVIVASEASTTDPLEHIGESAARYLQDILEDNSIIGTSWGKTVYACSRALARGRISTTWFMCRYAAVSAA
jgi:deoxyribonucleoside regulator